MEDLQPLAVDPRLPVTPRKREAEEWALVLQAEGLRVELARDASGFTVAVPTADVPRAAASLAAWQVERASAPPPDPDRDAPPALPTSSEVLLAIATMSALVAFHLGLERSGRLRLFIDRGESQASLVLAGETYRSLTALTLHADLVHAAGNALFGAFFLAALAGRLGLGLAFACFVTTGALGNLANSLYHAEAHRSIGASTGVFGLVGVLAGLAAWRRHRLGTRNRGAWVALAAGLAIVAMLGGAGPQVDLGAHLFGLAAGSLAGLALAYPLARTPRPGPAAQVVAFVAALGAIGLAWRFAGP